MMPGWKLWACISVVSMGAALSPAQDKILVMMDPAQTDHLKAYGMAYWGFHDVLVHRRVKHSVVPKGGYLKRIVRAHLIHHRTHTKEGATSFGFLF